MFEEGLMGWGAVLVAGLLFLTGMIIGKRR